MKQIEYIGYLLSKGTIRNSGEKQKELKAAHIRFLVERTKEKFRTLMGKLTFMTNIIPAMRGLSKSLYKILPAKAYTLANRKEKVVASEQDLSKLQELVDELVHKSPSFRMTDPSLRKLQTYVDASDDWLGFSSIPLDPREKYIPKQPLRSAYQVTMKLNKDIAKWDIYYKELLAAKIAVQTCPDNSMLLLYCDNQAVRGSISNPNYEVGLAEEMITAIHGNCVRRNIGLVVKYVDTHENYADYPSKFECKGKVNQQIFSDASTNAH